MEAVLRNTDSTLVHSSPPVCIMHARLCAYRAPSNVPSPLVAAAAAVAAVIAEPLLLLSPQLLLLLPLLLSCC